MPTDLWPSETIFPGSPIPVDLGGYSQPIECALSELVLTATDDHGVDWVQDTLTGWYGSPASSLQLQQKQRAPGGWPAPRQMTPRTLALAGFVEAPDGARLVDALDRLNMAASIDATLLTVSEFGLTRSCIVYRQDEVLVSRVGDSTAVWSLQVAAADPRKFGAAVAGSTGLPFASGGLVIPFTMPFTINSVIASGECHLNNPGNTNGPVRLRIDGPVEGPKVTHVGTGVELVFSSSLSIDAGEWLDVDMEAQTALANGQASRNGWITNRGWSAFEPGDNTWAFTAESGAGLLTVTATPAWQ